MNRCDFNNTILHIKYYSWIIFCFFKIKIIFAFYHWNSNTLTQCHIRRFSVMFLELVSRLKFALVFGTTFAPNSPICSCSLVQLKSMEAYRLFHRLNNNSIDLVIFKDIIKDSVINIELKIKKSDIYGVNNYACEVPSCPNLTIWKWIMNESWILMDDIAIRNLRRKLGSNDDTRKKILRASVQ